MKLLKLYQEQEEVVAARMSMPMIDRKDRKKFGLVNALVQSGKLGDWDNETPPEAYRLAEERVVQAMSILEAFKRCQAELGLVGLDGKSPANFLEAMIVSAIKLAALPSPRQAWLRRSLHLDQTVFVTPYATWSDLVSAETEFRQAFTGHGNRPWPSQGGLSEAAAVLKKRGLSKFLSSFSSAGQRTKALLDQMGSKGSVTAADVFERLATHVRQTSIFESDAVSADLFGSWWKGLETPLDEFADGIQDRLAILEKVKDLPGGVQIAERAIRLHDVSGDLSRFLDLATVALPLVELSEADRTEYLGASIASAIQRVKREIADKRGLLAIDPDQSLADVHLPIRQITLALDLFDREDRIAKEIKASALVANFPRHAITDLEGAIAAADWLTQVAQKSPNQETRSVLAGSEPSRGRDTLREYAQAATPLADQCRSKMASAEAHFGMTGLEALPVPVLGPTLQSLITSGLELSQFLDLRDQKQVIGSLGLTEFITRSDAIEVHPKDLAAVFETLLAYRRADAARRASPALARGTGASLDTRRKTFADRDRQKILTDRTIVKASLMKANPPVGSNAGPRKTWTEMALLNNEFSKQKRFTPVRGLLARGGRAIQDLKPCFMMSPLSLAKFLPRTMTFDLLVIDEASQMKPEDALGGMLRAKQIVVVGDPKQLPPTDFFNRSSETSPADTDDDFEDVDDESILEGCQKAFREVRRLKWHYRSKCESLIAFSNLEFYDKPDHLPDCQARILLGGSDQGRRGLSGPPKSCRSVSGGSRGDPLHEALRRPRAGGDSDARDRVGQHRPARPDQGGTSTPLVR